jgi:hypothetical protein
VKKGKRKETKGERYKCILYIVAVVFHGYHLTDSQRPIMKFTKEVSTNACPRTHVPLELHHPASK